MTRAGGVAAAVAVAIISLAGTVAREGGRRPATPAVPQPSVIRWWENATIVAELGLAPRQAVEIGRAVDADRERRLAIASKLREQRARLASMLGEETLDRQGLYGVVSEISRLQSQQIRALVHLRVEVRRILTPVQLARLVALHPGVMRQRWDRRAAKQPAAHQ